MSDQEEKGPESVSELSVGKMSFEIKASLFVRSYVRDFLEKQKAIHSKITIVYEEVRSFLSSTFLVDISGDPLYVEGWRLATKDLINEWNLGPFKD